MKKLLLFSAVSVALLSAGCQKIKQLANINVDIPYSSVINVPQAEGYSGILLPNGGVTLPFPQISLKTNSKEYIAKYRTSSDKIVDIDLKSLSLEILDPGGRNFDFLDYVEVYISANGLPEVLIAYDRNIPKGLARLDLYTETSVNLKSYYLQDTVYFRLNAHINATPPAGEQLQMSSVFHMLANPLE